MRSILRKISSLIGSQIPTTNIIAFCSFPDYSDNAWAFYRYLYSKEVGKKYKFVWLIIDKTAIESVRDMMIKDNLVSKVIYRKSIRGIWTFIRARYVFTTHGLFDFLSLKQHPDKNINLWHGMPLKLLGASEAGKKSSSTNSDYTIATSRLYQTIMSEALDKDLDHVLISGQPRNDLLFEETEWFKINKINRERYSKIGIWMPTYRRSIKGELRIDGSYTEDGISFLGLTKLREFDKFLSKQGVLLLVKIHPMDALQKADMGKYDNIIFIMPQDFHLQLYPLIGSCDFLLTDYSSVFIDYQILKKPIGFVMNDLDAYKNSRGFYFDNLVESLPGPILSDYYSLCDFIQKPYFKECDINFNDFYDNKSSERIATFFNLITR